MDGAYSFEKNFVSAKYEDLPRDIVEFTKKDLLNVLGVALAGYSSQIRLQQEE